MHGCPRTPARRSRRGLAAGSSFAAQGLGYTVIMTALPTFQTRWGIDGTVVSLLILGTCVTAAIGSVLADAIAVRYGSRVAAVIALLLQSATFVTTACAPTLPVFCAAILLYGIGLGTMDAAQNMQGVLAERAADRPIMGRFYAAYTGAAILGALGMSAVLASSGAVTAALLGTAVIDFAVAMIGIVWLDRARIARTPASPSHARPPLPTSRIVTVGLIVFAAYMLDSSVATWSTTYLQTGIGVTAAIAPLGYAAYQGAIFVTRLATTPLVTRLGSSRIMTGSLVLGIAGCLVVATVPAAPGAIVGFAAAGIAAGALIPIAFSAAGRILPARGDEVIARVNLFNYGGAVAGAVALGLISSGPGLGPAFLIPAGVLLLCAPLLRALRGSRAASPRTVPTQKEEA